MNALTESIERAVARHGSLRAAAKVLDINFAYLWRLKKGEKANPKPAVLRKLKVRKIVIWEHIT